MKIIVPDLVHGLPSVYRIAAGGIALGICASLGSVLPPPINVLTALLSAWWLWAFLGFCAGVYAAANTWKAGLAGVLALECAVIAYYTCDVVRGEYTTSGSIGESSGHIHWNHFFQEMLAWSALALVAGPLFGVLGAMAMRTGLIATLAKVSVVAVAVLELLHFHAGSVELTNAKSYVFLANPLLAAAATYMVLRLRATQAVKFEVG